MASEAARVHLPNVEARHAFDDPFGDEPAHPARPGQPVRAEACRDPEAAHLARPEDELPVRRERLRAVDQPDDFHVLQRRHAHECVRHQLLEARPVLLE